jgi:hypothetical protein
MDRTATQLVEDIAEALWEVDNKFLIKIAEEVLGKNVKIAEINENYTLFEVED